MAHAIRPARTEDADEIGAVHVRAWQAAYRGVMPDGYLDGLRASDRADMWRRHLTATTEDRHLRVVVADGHTVGFAGFGPEASREAGAGVGELYALNIDPDFWGRGFGRALLRNATDELAEEGFSEAVLWVVPQNERARHLYESEGWWRDAAERHDEVFGAVVPEMRYRRSLATQSRRSMSATSTP